MKTFACLNFFTSKSKIRELVLTVKWQKKNPGKVYYNIKVEGFALEVLLGLAGIMTICDIIEC